MNSEKNGTRKERVSSVKREDRFEKFLRLCQYYNVSLAQGFINGVKKDIFCLDFETIDYDQTTVLGECLKFLTGIAYLEIFGRFKNNHAISSSKVTEVENNKIQAERLSINPSLKNLLNSNKTRKKIKKTSKSHGFYHISKLLEGLNTNLYASKCLKELKLVGLALDKKSWKLFEQGLEAKNTVEYLYINYCHLKDSDLSYLQKGLYGKSLKVINLDNNQLEIECGEILGHVISCQNSLRENKLWKNSLRSPESRDSDSKLYEISLACNKLQDKFIVHISRYLCYDSCINGLNLQGNCITNEGYLEIMRLMELNNSLVYINLMDNQPPKDLELLHSIVEKLAYNLQEYKSKLWFDSEVEWDSRIMEMAAYIDSFSRISRKRPQSSKRSPGKKLLRTDVKVNTESPVFQHLELQRVNAHKPVRTCDNCDNFERELFHSKSQCIALQLKNNTLLRKLAVKIS